MFLLKPYSVLHTIASKQTSDFVVFFDLNEGCVFCHSLFFFFLKGECNTETDSLRFRIIKEEKKHCKVFNLLFSAAS
jgi:hypothetical protein